MDNSPAAADVLGISGMHVLDGYDVQRKTGQLFRIGIHYPLHRDINIRDLREVAILQTAVLLSRGVEDLCPGWIGRFLST
ncbi:MAG: hypothetical protein KAR73_15385, partial [Spirochaetales bacterium]|nr:hypothetical protein [Spirochaetales bacterium]